MRLSDLLGMLTVSGDRPQATMTPLVNGSPRQGTAVDPVDAIQQLFVNGTGGTFTLTYAPTVLGLIAFQDAINPAIGLAAGTYFYVVTAIPSAAEALPPKEPFAVPRPHPPVHLTPSPAPFPTPP